MSQGNPVSLGGRIILQGEKVVGADTVQLSTERLPCSQIRFFAPRASHNKGSSNSADILIGSGTATAGQQLGGDPLLADGSTNGPRPFSDASEVYLSGFSAGDAVEYQVIS